MYKLVRDGIDYYLVKPDDAGDELIVASTIEEHSAEHGIAKMKIDEITRAWLSQDFAQKKAMKAYPPEEHDETKAVKQVISRRAYAHGYRAGLVDAITNNEWQVEAFLTEENYFQIKNFL